MVFPHFRLVLRLIRESALFALEALRVNKLRTLLSLLGITIGIFAIISVFTVTDALERKIRKDVESLGNNVVYVGKWPWVPEGDEEYPWWKYLNRPLPGYREMQDLSRRTNTAEAVAYVANISNQTIKRLNYSVENITVSCVSYEYERVKSLDLSKGRYFTEPESNGGRAIALLGADVERGLFPSGNSVGQFITIRGRKLMIVGVIKKEGSSLLQNTSDNIVLVPVNYARNIANLRSDQIDPFIMVKAKRGVPMEELKADIKGAMRSIRSIQPRQEDDFALNETSLLSGSLKSLFATLGLAGWIIGGFSILVGGFGIANIMFVSVKERTPIIGIQKSLGARDYFILLQFLVESVVLCLLGGLIGLILVFGLSSLASSALDFDLSLTYGNILTGILISAGIGVLSGFVPALNASRMNPVDAIRSV
ncbi:MAG: ABC transporter permease [Bacteroidota bacterium]